MFRSMLRDLVDGPAKTVWVRQGLPPDDIENLWLAEAPDPSVNSSFKLGTAAQVRPYDRLLGSSFWLLQSARHHSGLPLFPYSMRLDDYAS
jgi:hypothetical protein